jgi:hypothetical protein
MKGVLKVQSWQATEKRRSSSSLEFGCLGYQGQNAHSAARLGILVEAVYPFLLRPPTIRTMGAILLKNERPLEPGALDSLPCYRNERVIQAPHAP